MKIIKVNPRQLTDWEIKEKLRLAKSAKPGISRTHSRRVGNVWYEIYRV